VRRLGAREVTVVEAAPALLAREEPFAGEEVRAGLEADGIKVHVGVRLLSASRGDDGSVTLMADGRLRLSGDELLVAAGRAPATGDLGLEAVGLAPGRPIDVDDRLRAVGVPQGWLYAIGDCNGRALLTHMGKYQGRIAADVILGRDARDRASGDVVPRVTFTDPQVAAVGLTSAQAEQRGLRVRVVRYGTGDVAGASVQGRHQGGTSALVVDEARRVLVGATFVGPSTAEMVHGATIAIAGAVSLGDLWHAVPSFPTVSEVWLRLLETYGL
jgi:dihydrolipoamide dehydrogenase